MVISEKSLNLFVQAVFISILSIACNIGDRQDSSQQAHPHNENLSIEIYDSTFTLLNRSDSIEILTEGFTWSEGPLWLESQQMLIFSDVPHNVIYSWSEKEGLQKYLTPSGYTSEDRTNSTEPGSNGLLLDSAGNLVICQHGDRRVARMDAPLTEPAARFSTLAGTYQGSRLNSPNDAALYKDGSIYFTDPPYGLRDKDEDPHKELPHNGVYRILPDGELILVVDSLTRPNGIAFSPDHKYLYVAQSDPERAIWMKYELDTAGAVVSGEVLFDATSMTKTEKGFPDGLKVHPSGYIFATGPGGVLVFSPAGNLVGTIRTGQATANCAFDSDFRYLYMTADAFLMRIRIHS